MAVHSGLGFPQLMGVGSVTVGQEYRISRSRFVKRDAGSVRGPRRRYGLRQEWSGGASEGGFQPRLFVALPIVSTEPDLSSVRRETDIAHGFVVQVDSIDPLRHVAEVAAADHFEPDIERSLPVRQEDGEFSIRRDGSIEFTALEIGQAAELSLGKRIDPEDI